LLQSADRPRLDETYGGQAVIEGVMMRDRTGMCIAVRTPDGDITCRREDFTIRPRAKLWSWPVFRGMAALYDSLRLGIDALLWSAEAAGQEDEKLEGWQVGLTMAVSLLIAVGLFMVLPTLLISWLRAALGAAGGGAPGETASYLRTIGLNLAEGAMRALILVLYVTSIARIPDVARVLQYHGAEHRVIHATESGAGLTVESARPYSVIHPRCGTSFLLYVVMVSVIVFSFFGWPGVWQRMAIRLSLLPLIAGVSYEWVRLAGRSNSWLVRALCQPGMWLQRATTREPDDAQLEVALAALRGLRGEEAAGRPVEGGQA